MRFANAEKLKRTAARLGRILLSAALVATSLAGPFAPAANAATQNAYRWRNDDGSEAAATWSAAENTAITNFTVNDTKRLRFGVANTGSESTLQQEAVYTSAGGSNNFFKEGGVIDTASGYAYFGARTNPGHIVRLRLSDFTIDGDIALPEGEATPSTGIIDTANGFAYFATNLGVSPARVIKIRLSDFTRVGSVAMAAGEAYIFGSAIDATAGYGYFATYTYPGKIVKIRLADLVEVGTLTLNAGEERAYNVILDAANGYGYVGLLSGQLLKFAMGSGNAAPTRVDAITFPGEGFPSTGVVDSISGYGYFGTSTGYVVKVVLNGSGSPTRVNSLNLGADSSLLYSSAIDLTNAYAYYTGFKTPDVVIKVALGSGANPPTRVGAATFNPTEANSYGLVIDPANGFGYVASVSPDRTGYIVKVNLGGAGAPSRAASVTTGTGNDYANALAIDRTHGFAYVGTAAAPGVVLKIRMSDGVTVGQTTLASGENAVGSLVVDGTGDYVYGTAGSNPGFLIKIRTSDMWEIPSVQLPTGETSPGFVSLDTVNGYGYAGTLDSPGKVVKFSMGTGDNGPVRLGSTGLGSLHNNVNGAALDTQGGYGYYGTATSPAYIVKVDLNPTSNTLPTVLGTATLAGSEINIRGVALDVPSGVGYVTATSVNNGTAPAKVVKFSLGSDAAAPSRLDALTLQTGQNQGADLTLDLTNGFAYVALTMNNGSALPGIAKVNLAFFTQTDFLLTAWSMTAAKSIMAIDAAAGNLWAATSELPARLAKVKTAQKPDLQLQVAPKSGGSCAATASGWAAVRAGDSPFKLVTSTYVGGGAATTDIASGVTNLRSSFNPGTFVSATSSSGAVALGEGQFTEVEYAVAPSLFAVDGASYCFRVADAAAPLASYSAVAEAQVAAFNGATLVNTVTLGRAKASSTAVPVSASFTLQNSASTPLTVTFPAGFTVTKAFTAGTCTTGGVETGTVDTFAFTSTTLTAAKHACSGTVTLSGAEVTLPSAAGTYTVSWVNDSPGFGTVYVTSADQIDISATVDPSIVFEVGASASCSGAYVASNWAIDLGHLNTGRQVASSGTSSVDLVCTRLSTNATTGAVVTVKNANGANGLVSASVPADKIPSASGAVTAGTPRYGLCYSTVGGDSGYDLGVTPAAYAPSTLAGSYSPSGSCTASATSGAEQVSALSTTPTQVWSVPGVTSNAFAAVRVKAAISGTQPAHNDYADILTFVATATY